MSLTHQRWSLQPPDALKGDRVVIYQERLPEGADAAFGAQYLDVHDMVAALAWTERDKDLSIAFPGPGKFARMPFTVRTVALDPRCIWLRREWVGAEAFLREWRNYRREMGDVLALARAHYLMGPVTWYLPAFEVATWPDDYDADPWVSA